MSGGELSGGAATVTSNKYEIVNFQKKGAYGPLRPHEVRVPADVFGNSYATLLANTSALNRVMLSETIDDMLSNPGKGIAKESYGKAAHLSLYGWKGEKAEQKKEAFDAMRGFISNYHGDMQLMDDCHDVAKKANAKYGLKPHIKEPMAA